MKRLCLAPVCWWRSMDRLKTPKAGASTIASASAAGAATGAAPLPPATATEPAATAVTPSMAQFLDIKASHPDCLLFYRMGDFYELFFEDAVAAAEARGIGLTKRGKHLAEDIPMCRVPDHHAGEYLQDLSLAGPRETVWHRL